MSHGYESESSAWRHAQMFERTYKQPRECLFVFSPLCIFSKFPQIAGIGGCKSTLIAFVKAGHARCLSGQASS